MMKNVTQTAISTFGIFSGITGLEHGIGEILQGNINPGSVAIKSWADSTAIGRVLGGEPAMTLIPNYRISGILTILVSLVFIVWTVAFVRKKHGGLMLFLLSICMLLVGGGYAPPLIGLFLSAAAPQINAPIPKHLQQYSKANLLRLGQVWKTFYIIALVAGLWLFPISVLVGLFINIQNEALLTAVSIGFIGFLLLTLFTGITLDHQTRATTRK